MSKKKALEGVMEWKEYEDQLTEEEKEYVRQFYSEYHANGRYNSEEPILTADEHIREANRNYNSLYRDAFNVSRTLNRQVELTPDQREVYELASDETDWETTYNQQGPKAALEVIMDQAVRDIDAGQDKRVVLSRFYVKMKRLSSFIKKEKRRK